MKRIISLVPSWTETLIKANLNVVGRTRFCIHPEDLVKEIPTVGGTKNPNWEKIYSLKPDLIILDKEENKKEFIDHINCKWWASHICKLEDVSRDLKDLNLILNNKNIDSFIARWQEVASKPRNWDFSDAEWLQRNQTNYNTVYYMIWKKPWMAASQNTFIGSVLNHIGLTNLYHDPLNKYPEVSIDAISEKDLVLFSSEPYPFHREKENLAQYPFDSAIVNGENFSWFGIRSLEFLESLSFKG